MESWPSPATAQLWSPGGFEKLLMKGDPPSGPEGVGSLWVQVAWGESSVWGRGAG